MIIAGAYWANRTWGSYWSWDPKEDWALITWLTYAGYLHMRLTRGWRGRRSAYFAIIGFGVVMFTFFGVTYLLPGLHAYA
jgi:ABC-type transport system involved in cytochrome c biogenesis permease subunit